MRLIYPTRLHLQDYKIMNKSFIHGRFIFSGALKVFSNFFTFTLTSQCPTILQSSQRFLRLPHSALLPRNLFRDLFSCLPSLTQHTSTTPRSSDERVRARNASKWLIGHHPHHLTRGTMTLITYLIRTETIDLTLHCAHTGTT